MAKEPTWKTAIKKVLATSPTPLHYKEITEQVISEGLRKNVGATPSATVNAQITRSIKYNGAKSPFVRVGKGTFTLRDRSDAGTVVHKKLTPEKEESEEVEEQYEIVSSFGMFWKKSGVGWSCSPKLLGMQQIGAKPVDFCNQLGIYLLYDGREVIYAGRTTDSSLGTRLYYHTVDRMSARWDRFSWFGLLPVSDDGSLGELPESYDAAKLIPALESILIEALEPRQNRKRGDDLAAVEYLQKVDPEIEKNRRREILDELANKL